MLTYKRFANLHTRCSVACVLALSATILACAGGCSALDTFSKEPTLSSAIAKTFAPSAKSSPEQEPLHSPKQSNGPVTMRLVDMSAEKQPDVVQAGFFRPSKLLQPRKLVTPIETLEVIENLRKLELSGKLNEAEAGYKKLISSKSPHWMAYHRLGVLYALRQQSSQAQEMFRKAIEINPNNADLLCDAGFQSQRIGDWETARSLYQQALQLDARHSRSHNHFAVLLVSANEIDAARQHFKLAGLSDAEVEENVSAARQ